MCVDLAVFMVVYVGFVCPSIFIVVCAVSHTCSLVCFYYSWYREGSEHLFLS